MSKIIAVGGVVLFVISVVGMCHAASVEYSRGRF